MTNSDISQIIKFLREETQKIVKLAVPNDDVVFRDADLIQDLGCDSLDMISLLFNIEAHFSITIPEPDIDEYELSKVGNLANYIAERRG